MSNKDFDPFTGKIQESEGVENNSFFHRFWDNLKKNKITLVCLFLLGIIIFLSVFIFLSPYDPDKVYISEKYMPSGKLHIWGTDAMGRDYFTRAFYGGRVSENKKTRSNTEEQNPLMLNELHFSNVSYVTLYR